MLLMGVLLSSSPMAAPLAKERHRRTTGAAAAIVHGAAVLAGRCRQVGSLGVSRVTYAPGLSSLHRNNTIPHGTALCRAPVSSVTAHRRSATMAPTLSNLIPSPALHQRAADTMSPNDEQLQAY